MSGCVFFLSFFHFIFEDCSVLSCIGLVSCGSLIFPTSVITLCAPPVYVNPSPALRLCQIFMWPLPENFLTTFSCLISSCAWPLFDFGFFSCSLSPWLLRIFARIFAFAVLWNKKFVMWTWCHFQNLVLRRYPTTSILQEIHHSMWIPKQSQETEWGTTELA